MINSIPYIHIHNLPKQNKQLIKPVEKIYKAQINKKNPFQQELEQAMLKNNINIKI